LPFQLVHVHDGLPTLLHLPMTGSHSFLLPALALLFGLASGDTCRTVENAYKTIEVAHRNSPAYYNSQNDYWNKALSKTKPTCVIYPASARDAQRVIDVLGANTEQFAIKAGGQNPNPDFSRYDWRLVGDFLIR
jgi:hypothetical protein